MLIQYQILSYRLASKIQTNINVAMNSNCISILMQKANFK
jgi:hypothetical protein